MSESSSLRERTRRAVAAEITAAAIGLFAEQGFEATTVDQIAVAAGLSRRSFFRYFPTKEEVLLQAFNATGEQLCSALAERPGAETPWTALRRTFDLLVAGVEAAPDRSAVLLHMMLASPALHGAHLAKQVAWQQMLSTTLLARQGQPADAAPPARLEVSSLTGSALACLEAAQTAWTQNRRRPAPARDPELDDLAGVLDRAMHSVHPLHPSKGAAAPVGDT